MTSPGSAQGQMGMPAVFELFAYVFRQKRLLIRAVGILFVSCLLQLAFPWGAGQLVDGTLKRGNPFFHNIDHVCLILLVIVVLVLAARYLEMRWFQSLGERSMAEMRMDAFSHLVRLPASWHARFRAGDLSSRLLADLSQIQELWVFDFRMLLTYGLLLLGGIVMLLVTSWQLALIVFAVAPLVAALAWLISPHIRQASSRAQEKLAESSIIVGEAVQSIPTVKTCGGEEYESARYRRSVENFLTPALRGGNARALFVSCIVAMLLCTCVFMMWHGSHMIRRGELSPGQFTTFMFYLAFSGSAGGVIAEIFGKVQRALGAHERLREILDAEPEHLGGQSIPSRKLTGALEFENVCFSYPSRPEKLALQGVSFVAKPGQVIAVTGVSGSGKSTLAALLSQLYPTASGSILFDGQPATAYPLGWLRSQMALVPQEILLIGGTIAENIAYAVPTATRVQIETAAAKAHALDFINALPSRFETLVGDRGAQLSGGQRQRIALARAFLRDPAILILDEAASALDAASEAQVQAALDDLMRGRTTIVIAHRLASIRKADLILVLSEGRIVESGTHEELLAARRDYWFLWSQQTLG